MMTPGPSAHIWIAAGHTDMRRGMHGLSALVQTALAQSPFSGHVFVFRGRRGHLIKILWFDGDGLRLFLKKLERGRFVWPQAENSAVSLTRALLCILLDDIDWTSPRRTGVMMSPGHSALVRAALSQSPYSGHFFSAFTVTVDGGFATLGNTAHGYRCRAKGCPAPNHCVEARQDWGPVPQRTNSRPVRATDAAAIELSQRARQPGTIRRPLGRCRRTVRRPRLARLR